MCLLHPRGSHSGLVFPRTSSKYTTVSRPSPGDHAPVFDQYLAMCAHACECLRVCLTWEGAAESTLCTE